MSKSLIISLIIGVLAAASFFVLQALSKRRLRLSVFYICVLGVVVVMIAIVRLAEWTIPG
jgi:uncharacterized membrane protein